ncbi:MAG: Na+/H+ antiporter subunit E [Treponema sp.]|nr:Na+/H+ antiporter subunit E [Treponema sp.]
MFVIYLIIWLIISMRLSIEVVTAGAIISIAVYWFARSHLRYRSDFDLKMLRNTLRGIKYAFILVKETAKANISVFRIVFSKDIEVEPRLVYFRTYLKTNTARVVLANSITLTPGTITVALNDNLFCVYCLDSKIAEGVDDSIFSRKLREFEE